jgi:cysteinyl-tRNA synthetase
LDSPTTETSPETRMRKSTITILACLAISSAASGAEKKWDAVKSWIYQLSDYKGDRLKEIADANFDLAVIDLARDGGKDYFTSSEIKAVKKTGKLVLAYFEIGAIEEYRPEWKLVPGDLKAGSVEGWPKEQYVKYWDERWWPIVKGRVDRALQSGFDGAYLDMVTTYDEIRGSGLKQEVRARKMVELIARISKYAKARKPDFKIVPQNCPELYTWSYWDAKPNRKYIDAIDGLGLESVFYLAHDKPASKKWCRENRDNALAIKKAGKLVLGVDYAKKPKSIADSYRKQRAVGFVPYVSVEALDRVCRPPTSD